MPSQYATGMSFIQPIFLGCFFICFIFLMLAFLVKSAQFKWLGNIWGKKYTFFSTSIFCDFNWEYAEFIYN